MEVLVGQRVFGIALGHEDVVDHDQLRHDLVLAILLLVVAVGGSIGQVGAILLGGIAGLALCRGTPAAAVGHLAFPVLRRAGAAALVAFAAFLLLPPLLAGATGAQAVALFDAFYRSGALVFGGGHVVRNRRPGPTVIVG